MSITASSHPVNETVLILEPNRVEENYWTDLWRYRELFGILAWRDISVRYKPIARLDKFMFKQASLNHVRHHPNFDVVNGDIRIEIVVTPLIREADIIIPLAALVGAPFAASILWVPPQSTTTP